MRRKPPAWSRACRRDRPASGVEMDFLAFVVALVAFIVVLRMRSRHRLARAQHRADRPAAGQRRRRRQQAAPEAPHRSSRALRSSLRHRFAGGRTRERAGARGGQSRGRTVHPDRRAPSSCAAAAEPEAPAKSFEERFGASWVVWIGGLALALGGIFLVQYSIEAGLIGPKVRIFLGGLLATALIAAGEWTRRREFSVGLDASADRAYSEHPDGGRHHGRLRDDLRGLRALRLPRARHRLRAARHRGARDARGLAAARAGARGARPDRRVRHAAADREPRSRTTGRSTSISRS